MKSYKLVSLVASSLACAIVVAIVGVAEEAQAAPGGSPCGTINWQDVEQYNGTLGPYGTSREFADRHETPVGQLKWVDNLSSIYPNTGDVQNGDTICSGTLISRNMFLTAAHCLESSPTYLLPLHSTGRRLSPSEAAPVMEVLFNYQKDPSGNVQAGVAVTVSSLVEIRAGNHDYAILRLEGSPGNTYGFTRVAASDLTPGDELTIMGHPNGIPKIIDSGTVGSFSSDKVRYSDIDTNPGSSGAGVLDWQGRLVAVHTSGGCTATGGSNGGVLVEKIVEDSTTLAGIVSEYGPHSEIIAVGDFNWDTIDDVVVGEPGATVNGNPAAGRVRVVYGTSSGPGTTETWHQDSSGVSDTSEAGDFFGAAVAVGDFNGDGYDDLAIGVPGEAIGSVDNAGHIQILEGSSGGLTATGMRAYQGSSLGGVAEAEDRVGSSLASGDFDDDGVDDLAIGVPGENSDTGYFHVLYGKTSGLSSSGTQFISQNNVGGAVPEAGDRFASSLTVGDFDGDNYDDIAIGAPGEAIGALQNAGAVSIMYGSSSGLSTSRGYTFHQDTSGIWLYAGAGDYFGTSLAAADFDNDGLDDLAIGVPGEDLSFSVNTGGVHVLYGAAGHGISSDGDVFLKDPAAVFESEDRFGMSLAAGRLNPDQYGDLAVGSPGQAIGTLPNAGAVVVFYGRNGEITATGSQVWHQDVANVHGSINGVAERSDRFGTSLAIGYLNNTGFPGLVISVPGEEWGTTLEPDTLHYIFSNSSGLSSWGDALVLP